ncbi:MAG: hypothetical protein QM640_03250 [Niabella sp.]
MNIKKTGCPGNLFYTFLLSTVIISCSNKKEIFETAAISDYLPLAVGKYITYRLDSAVFTQSGAAISTNSYQVKHVISSTTEDNAGQLTYIVQRFINDVDASGAWISNGTYLITPYDNKTEVINDNQRIIVLQAPLKTGFTWNGNSYLIHPDTLTDASPYSDLYDMYVDDEMYKWDFTYLNYGDEQYEGQQYANVWTVQQNNDSLNIPPTSATSYGYKAVSTEKYAKGIGLVYKTLQLYDYQGASTDNSSAHYTGFGITMWMIDHN